jgi:nucleoside-diphosphate-sugar epimerase
MTSLDPLRLRKCIVTGAAGFVGSHLTRRLVTENVGVNVVVHAQTDMWRLFDFEPRIHVHHCGVENIAALEDVSDVDVIFHLAASGTNQEDSDIDSAISTNVLGTLEVLRLARRIGARVVAAGSMLEYGPGLGHRESGSLAPVNEYAASKAAAWLLSRAYASRHGVPLAWLRTSSIYGPAQTPSFVIPYFIVQALQNKQIFLSDGAAARDFVYVEDAVGAFVAAATVACAPGEAFNVCSGRLVTVKEVAEAIDEAIGGTSRPSFGVYNDRAAGVDTCSANPEKSRTLLRWEATTPLRDGLLRTVHWYRDHEALWHQAFAESGYSSLRSASTASARQTVDRASRSENSD